MVLVFSHSRLCKGISYSHLHHVLSTLTQEYNITTRQHQLAKLTPSALIEMAYLCALLEQHPFSKSKPSSHKFEVIRLFLEDVVHVVPFESIFYAIANCSLDTAMSCFQALKSYQLDLPTSELMGKGLNLAAWRMDTGVSGSTTLELQGKADFTRLHFSTVVLHVDSNEISFTQLPRAPGQMMQPLTSEVIAEKGLVTASVKRGEVEFFPVTKECKDAAKYLNMVK